MKTQNNIVHFDKSLFWDANVSELNLENDYFYIIKRIVLKGDRKDRILMFSWFSKDKINEVLNATREISQNLKEVYLRAINE
jgi:hypothetical protein